MNLTRIPAARAAAGIVAGVLLVAGGVSSRSHWSTSASDVDLVTAAHADVGRTAVEDAQARTVAVARGGHATATATASTVCDGCSGRAATVQVAYVARGGITADNVAAAWATGTSGTATSASVQVVIQRPGTDVVATNRALAVGTACSACTTDATAVQVVVLSRRDRKVSVQVQALLQQLADLLGTPVPTGPRLREAGHHHGARQASYPLGGSAPALVTSAALLAAADATSPEQQTLDALVAQLQAEFGADAVTVDVDTSAG
ncbi:hypothetical protein [Xylanimonas protaetiae]|uniref:Uncharacterized protein n=1 Tax=Xylanimonas protaetiae TaxID=2509457 RepID=A0A4P6F4D7_9MICO|nr:hypothetical protein [Xylanimonas protaetiae]QAY69079.1 hypothetical protein ET471_02650 [Xylanimonas protaetiae]